MALLVCLESKYKVKTDTLHLYKIHYIPLALVDQFYNSMELVHFTATWSQASRVRVGNGRGLF